MYSRQPWNADHFALGFCETPSTLWSSIVLGATIVTRFHQSSSGSWSICEPWFCYKWNPLDIDLHSNPSLMKLKDSRTSDFFISQECALATISSASSNPHSDSASVLMSSDSFTCHVVTSSPHPCSCRVTSLLSWCGLSTTFLKY